MNLLRELHYRKEISHNPLSYFKFNISLSMYGGIKID